MIGRLRGEILSKRPPQLLLDVNGVGYELEAPMSTFYELPDVGQSVTLFTHLLVREDAHILYAFASEPEREMFRALLKVNGVGGETDKYWLWSYYEDGWQSGMVGADQWRLHDGDAAAWTYTGFS